MLFFRKQIALERLANLTLQARPLHELEVCFYIGPSEYVNACCEAVNNSNSPLFLVGLEKLHELTSTASIPFELRVDLQTHNDSAYAKYDLFRVGSSRERYRLSLGNYRGTAGK